MASIFKAGSYNSSLYYSMRGLGMARLFLTLSICMFSSICAAQNPTASEVFGDYSLKLEAWKLDDIVWDEVYADGSKLAILEGPRDIPGESFTYAFFLPDGIMVGGHWHCAEARVFVAMGSMMLGLGEIANIDTAVEYPAGSYLIVPHRAAHYEAAKGDLLIYGTGIGPWCTVETE